MNAGNIILKYEKFATGKDNLKDEDKIAILAKIVNSPKYVNYKDKQSECKKIILNNFKYDCGNLMYDSSELYYQFVVRLLNIYFDLDENEHTYNSLSAKGILPFLLVLISEEYQMFKGVLDSYVNDIKNKNLLLEDLCNNE